jgi:hypothetical protein
MNALRDLTDPNAREQVTGIVMKHAVKLLAHRERGRRPI